MERGLTSDISCSLSVWSLRVIYCIALSVLELRRGVSGLIAVLILGVVMVGLLSAAIALTSRLHGVVGESVDRASRVLSDASQPPILSLYSEGGSLYVDILAGKPVEALGILVDLGDGLEFKPLNGTLDGVSRLELVRGYNCEPVRVYLALASGYVVSYNPALDPRVGRVPELWDGWWRCGLPSGGFTGGVVDPGSWLKARGSSGGGNETVVLPVGFSTSDTRWTIYIGSSLDQYRYTWGECLIEYIVRYVNGVPVYDRAPQVTIGSFQFNGSEVDVVLGCTQGWPIAVYIAIRGPEGVVYSGRVEFNYSTSYTPLVEWKLYKDDPWLSATAGPIPISYTPQGSSRYKATMVDDLEWTGGYEFEGWGTIDFRESTAVVLIAWGTLLPQGSTDYPYVVLDISRLYVRVDNATRVYPRPAVLDLGTPEALKLRLYTYNVSVQTLDTYNELSTTPDRVRAPDPISTAVYKVYTGELKPPMAPTVYLVIETKVGTSRRPLQPGVEVVAAYPSASFKVEVYPSWHPPLANGVNATYMWVDDRTKLYEGGTSIAPNPSPWAGPAVLEVETPAGRELTAISWPGKLEIIQAGVTWRGYAQIIPDQPYTVNPQAALRASPATIDPQTLTVRVTLTINAKDGWNLASFSGRHAILIAASNYPESIVAWIN